jgi:hypothetical protein
MWRIARRRQNRISPIMWIGVTTEREDILRSPTVAKRNRRQLRQQEKKDGPGRRERENAKM